VPHPDVLDVAFQQFEFAGDLMAVWTGKATPEYGTALRPCSQALKVMTSADIDDLVVGSAAAQGVHPTTCPLSRSEHPQGTGNWRWIWKEQTDSELTADLRTRNEAAGALEPRILRMSDHNPDLKPRVYLNWRTKSDLSLEPLEPV